MSQGKPFLLLETCLIAQALVNPGGAQYPRDEQSQHAGHDPGRQQQQSCTEQAWRIAEQLIQDPVKRLGDERQAQHLEEGHQHKEQDEVVNAPCHPFFYRNRFGIFFAADPAGYAVVHLCAVEHLTDNGGDYPGHYPPDDQDSQRAQGAGNSA